MNEIKFNPKILKNYFDLAVREACRSCKRFGYKNTCPPFIPEINYYKNLLPSYEGGLIIYKKFKIQNINNWQELGKKSSLEIHSYLLNKRNELIKKGFVLNLALTAGSCKLCSKCSFPCAHPDKALIPVEGTGINLIKFMKKFKINIIFPIEKNGYFYRIGMILWKN
jgi:predicted metal-binding protein